MERLRFKRIWQVLLWILILGIPLTAQTPLDVVKQSNQKILEIYKNYENIDANTEEQIIQIINSVTDFEEISKRTIEQFCLDMSPQECEELDRTFKTLLQISSIKKLGRYRADRFDYLDEKIVGTQAVVKTIAYYQDDEMELDYHLKKADDTWLVVNYVADGVDTIRNYRKQFMRILKKESYPQLIARLKKKIDEHRKEDHDKN
jgi:phospholipid transport system substrate-binding protein